MVCAPMRRGMDPLVHEVCTNAARRGSNVTRHGSIGTRGVCQCGAAWTQCGVRSGRRCSERLRPRPQRLLVELSDGRLRHLVDEADLVRDPPLHEVLRQMSEDLLGRKIAAELRARDDEADGTLLP